MEEIGSGGFQIVAEWSGSRLRLTSKKSLAWSAINWLT